MENYFSQLNAINVNDKTEKKGRLTYLSWAWAWGEIKKLHPDAIYTVYENADGWNYHTDGRTCWVKTGLTVNGIEHIEYLPVMDARNASISLENVTSFDVNKAIQRSLTKAAARHGLGLYIYAGEDLPEGEEPQAEKKQLPPPILCQRCGKPIMAYNGKAGKFTAEQIAGESMKAYHSNLCWNCMRVVKKAQTEQAQAEQTTHENAG